MKIRQEKGLCESCMAKATAVVEVDENRCNDVRFGLCQDCLSRALAKLIEQRDEMLALS